MSPYHLDHNTLNEYLDSALEPARRAEVESHLAACPDCAARLAELRALFAALESLPDAPLERDLSSSVVAVLNKRLVMSGSANALYSRPVLRLIFVVQALASLALISITLPFAAQTLEFAGTPQFTSQVTTFLTDVTTAFNSTWAAALNSAQSLLSQGQAVFDNLPLPTLPALGLGAFFAAVSALWIVGNGLLLTRAYQIKR